MRPVIDGDGFYFRNVEFYPSIFNYFVPEYRHAEAGLAKLTSTYISLPIGNLLPKDDGFQQLSQIYFNDLSASNNNIPIALSSNFCPAQPFSAHPEFSSSTCPGFC